MTHKEGRREKKKKYLYTRMYIKWFTANIHGV